MRVHSCIRLRDLGAMAVLLLVLGSRPAGAQCEITGPATLCGGSAELCGPEGPYEYEWTDPNGTPLGAERCLTVTAPGTYQLSVFDFMNGLWFGPCSHTVGAGEVGTCEIQGGGTTCEGGTVELCGPEMAAEFRWTGPAGFAADSRCIAAGVAGVYQLQVRSGPDACWSLPCEAAVSFEPCGGGAVNCPLTAAAWLRQCRWGHRHRTGLGREQIAGIAACVDERSGAFAWKDATEGLFRTLKSRGSLQERARRQFAGAMANVCAREHVLATARGPARGLDPATTLQLDGHTGTIGDWLAATDQELRRLDGKRSRDREAKAAYRAIIRAGWQINHGLGIGPTCDTQQLAAGDAAGAVATPEPLDLSAFDSESALADESLESELLDPEGSLALESMEPNPASGPVRIAYVVSSGAASEVSLGVYDVAGRLVRELDRGMRTPGRYEVSWDGRDAAGHAMRNGAYFLMGRVGGQRIEGRLILLR